MNLLEGLFKESLSAALAADVTDGGNGSDGHLVMKVFGADNVC